MIANQFETSQEFRWQRAVTTGGFPSPETPSVVGRGSVETRDWMMEYAMNWN